MQNNTEEITIRKTVDGGPSLQLQGFDDYVRTYVTESRLGGDSKHWLPARFEYMLVIFIYLDNTFNQLSNLCT